MKKFPSYDNINKVAMNALRAICINPKGSQVLIEISSFPLITQAIEECHDKEEVVALAAQVLCFFSSKEIRCARVKPL